MFLGKVYYDTKHPAALGSDAKLGKVIKNKKRDVETCLSGQNTYTLIKHVRKTFPRNPYTVTTIYDVWGMDLADLSPFRNTISTNNSYKSWTYFHGRLGPGL